MTAITALTLANNQYDHIQVTNSLVDDHNKLTEANNNFVSNSTIILLGPGTALTVNNAASFGSVNSNSYISATQIIGTIIQENGIDLSVYANAIYASVNVANSTSGLGYTTANSAYGEANTANNIAQAAYNQANTANSSTGLGYIWANNAFNSTNSAWSLANTANSTSGLGYIWANTAYGQANLANSIAQAAYNQANTPAAGYIWAFAGLNAPPKTLFTNGANVSRTTWSVLFNTLTANVGVATINIANSSTVVTANNHGLVPGNKISFETTGNLYVGISTGNNYWITTATQNTFTFSNTAGGSNVVMSGAQSGTITIRHNPWGCGDGITTFQLPYLAGRFLAGADNMTVGSAFAGVLGNGPAGGFNINGVIGALGGEQSHIITTAELATHNHGVNDPSHGHSISDPSHTHYAAGNGNFVQTNGGYNFGGFQYGTSQYMSYYPTTTYSGTGIGIYANYTGISIQNNGSSAGHNTVPPAAVVYFVITTGT